MFSSKLFIVSRNIEPWFNLSLFLRELSLNVCSSIVSGYLDSVTSSAYFIFRPEFSDFVLIVDVKDGGANDDYDGNLGC